MIPVICTALFCNYCLLGVHIWHNLTTGDLGSEPAPVYLYNAGAENQKMSPVESDNPADFLSWSCE